MKPSGYGVWRQFLVPQWGRSAIAKVRKGIGATVRSFRKWAGLSQEKLGEKADMHPAYISQAERGTKAVAVEALCCGLFEPQLNPFGPIACRPAVPFPE